MHLPRSIFMRCTRNPPAPLGIIIIRLGDAIMMIKWCSLEFYWRITFDVCSGRGRTKGWKQQPRVIFLIPEPLKIWTIFALDFLFFFQKRKSTRIGFALQVQHEVVIWNSFNFSHITIVCNLLAVDRNAKRAQHLIRNSFQVSQERQMHHLFIQRVQSLLNCFKGR